MDLIFWRHADAVAADKDTPQDAQRELTPKGRRQAKRMAGWLKKRLPDDCRILVSPAVRARQTADALTDDYKTTKSIDMSAGGGALLEAARWPRGKGTVMLVGHQPGMGAAIALALTGKEGDWAIRKGGIWWLRLDDGDERPVVIAALDPRLV